MSGPVSSAPELNHQSSITRGLRDSQIVVLSCEAERWVRGSGQDPLSQPSTSVWATGQYKAHRGIMDPGG